MHQRWFPVVLVLGALTACVPKAYDNATWTHPELRDNTRVARDKYECMQENTHFASSRTEDHGGRRASAGMETDPFMVKACMEARGYVQEEKEKGAGKESDWATRDPAHRAPILSAELGYGGSFGLDHDVLIDYSAVFDDPSGEPTTKERVVVNNWTGFSFALGAAAPVHDFVELGARVGLRKSNTTSYIDCQTSTESADCTPYERDGTELHPFASAGVRGRLPVFPRLSAHADIGLTTVGPSEPYSGEVHLNADEERTETVAMTGYDTVLLPTLRYGLGFDVVYAEPWGLVVGCAMEHLLRDSMLQGYAQLDGPEGGSGYSGSSNAFSCSLGLRWSPPAK